ncbi:MAG: class I SAM-dependent methyltransferase [Dehalococcoidales bacterium]|nr:class I SAM-dependent methyltransferase [Dehalococcoidales bacterium]
MQEKKIQASELYARIGSPGSGDEARIRRLIDPVSKFVTGKVLVIGCGRGAELKVIEELTGISPVSVDINPHFIEGVRQQGYEALVCDLDKGVPLGNGTFDTVYAADILEHVESPTRVLRESYRVLTPGGTLIVLAPNVDFRHERSHPFHLNYFSKKAMRFTLESSGFRPKEVFLGPFIPRSVYKKLNKVSSLKGIRTLIIKTIFNIGMGKSLAEKTWKFMPNRRWRTLIYAVGVKDEEAFEQRYAKWEEALLEGDE